MLGQPKINKVQAPATYEMLRLKIVREQPLLRFHHYFYRPSSLRNYSFVSSFTVFTRILKLVG